MGRRSQVRRGSRGLTAAGARTVTQSPSVPKVHGRGSRRRTLAAVRGDRGPAVTFGPNPSTRRVSPGTEELRPSCPSAAAPPAPHPRVLRAERGREGHAQTGVGGTVGQGPTRWRMHWVSRIRDQMRTRRIVSGSFLVPRRRVRPTVPTVPHVTGATSPPKGSSSPLRLLECSRRKT